MATGRVDGVILTDRSDTANLTGQGAVEVRVRTADLSRGRTFPDGETAYRLQVPERAQVLAITQPWHRGEQSDRFRGYSDPETGLLHNFVGAKDPWELRTREDTFVEARAALWHAAPRAASFDFDHIKALHGHLFQDVYPWAGEPRTVKMIRQGGPPFYEPKDFAEVWGVIGAHIESADRWRGASTAEFAHGVPAVFNEVNMVHAFREGNGRTQREFFQQLAAESGHRIEWTAISRAQNDVISQAGREGDLRPLEEGFKRMIVAQPKARTSLPNGPGRVMDASVATKGSRSYLDRSRGQGREGATYGR